MRILVHDFAGHPFQAQLSRELARRGHHVYHGWFFGDTGPKGKLQKTEDDPESLEFVPFGASIDYSKTNFLKRRSGDVAYGKEVGVWISQHKPDIVISGNTPTEAQESIVKAAGRAGAGFVYWCQDFFSIAVSRLLGKRLPVVGPILAAYYRFLERRQMRRASHIIHISEGFVTQTDAWNIARDKVSVVPNWAPLDELPQFARDNDWTAANMPDDPRPRIIYSGTLGMKHNPAYLLDLAEHLPNAMVAICSEGAAVDALKDDPRAQNLDNIRFFPWVSFADLPRFLSGGDILTVLLEEDAGAFSVPSKILTYCAMGRAVLGSIPADNLGAQILVDNDIGFVSTPSDRQTFLDNARKLIADPARRQKMGENGRAYAETTFDIVKIADQFETILSPLGGAT